MWAINSTAWHVNFSRLPHLVLWPDFIERYMALWVNKVETVCCEADINIHLSTLLFLTEFGHHSEMSDCTSNWYYSESGPIHQGKGKVLLRWVKRKGGGSGGGYRLSFPWQNGLIHPRVCFWCTSVVFLSLLRLLKCPFPILVDIYLNEMWSSGKKNKPKTKASFFKLYARTAYSGNIRSSENVCCVLLWIPLKCTIIFTWHLVLIVIWNRFCLSVYKFSL